MPPEPPPARLPELPFPHDRASQAVEPADCRAGVGAAAVAVVLLGAVGLSWCSMRLRERLMADPVLAFVVSFVGGFVVLFGFLLL